MHVKAPAKINLNLHITGRRDDGYHLLDSLMVLTDWGDEIFIESADKLIFTVDGPYASVFTPELLSTESDSSNLIIQAVYIMAKQAGRSPKLKIHLIKKIPAGAGLGGGSSDAAAVMHLLNDLWGLNLSLGDLCALGLQLGAELPVCLHGGAVRVRGIGEVIEPTDIPLLPILIVWPDVGLLTKDVFDVYRRHCEVAEGEGKNPYNRVAGFKIDSSVISSRNDEFIMHLQNTTNDLTDAALSLCPEISNILKTLKQSQGCQLARMSGSGAACFGIFENRNEAALAANNFKNAVLTQISP